MTARPKETATVAPPHRGNSMSGNGTTMATTAEWGEENPLVMLLYLNTREGTRQIEIRQNDDVSLLASKISREHKLDKELETAISTSINRALYIVACSQQYYVAGYSQYDPQCYAQETYNTVAAAAAGNTTSTTGEGGTAEGQEEYAGGAGEEDYTNNGSYGNANGETEGFAKDVTSSRNHHSA